MSTKKPKAKRESEIERARSEVIIAAIRFSESSTDGCYEPMMELDTAVKAYKSLRNKDQNAQETKARTRR